jgi:hypothetical protein
VPRVIPGVVVEDGVHDLDGRDLPLERVEAPPRASLAGMIDWTMQVVVPRAAGPASIRF